MMHNFLWGVRNFFIYSTVAYHNYKIYVEDEIYVGDK